VLPQIVLIIQNLLFCQPYLPRNIKIMLFKSLIMCHIDYCKSIWGGDTPALTKPLFTLQKKAIRLVTQSTYNAHTDPLFHELNTLKFQDLHEYACTKLAFQVIDTTSPLGIQECFQLLDQINSLRSRSTKTLLIPHCLTTATMRMSAYLVTKIHSALPLFLKDQTSFSLKTAFFMVKMSDYSVFSCNIRKCY
jgi:hypothetical protein